MKLIKTANFELAVYEKGDPTSERVALVLPGRLDTKDYIHMTSLVDALAHQGFYALSFDPPGSWESSDDFTIYTTTSYLAATNELIQKLGSRPTFLAGHSRGGADAMLASKDNKCVTGLALMMASYAGASPPVSGDIKNGQYVTLRDLPPGIDKNGPSREMKLSLDYFEDSKKYQPQVALEQFIGPKLLIAATKDLFHTAASIKQIYDKLSDPKEYQEFESVHDYRFHPEVVQAVNESIIAFVKKYLTG